MGTFFFIFFLYKKMGKSIRSKRKRKFISIKRDKVANWQARRQDEILGRLMESVVTQETAMELTPFDQMNKPKATISVEIEGEEDDMEMNTTKKTEKKSSIKTTITKKTSQRKGRYSSVKGKVTSNDVDFDMREERSPAMEREVRRTRSKSRPGRRKN